MTRSSRQGLANTMRWKSALFRRRSLGLPQAGEEVGEAQGEKHRDEEESGAGDQLQQSGLARQSDRTERQRDKHRGGEQQGERKAERPGDRLADHEYGDPEKDDGHP